MNRRILSLFVASFVLACEQTALADTELAVDFNVGVPRLPKRSLTTGTGFDGRLGKDFSIGAVHLTPETCGGYMSLGSKIVRLLVGLRFSVSAPVAPSLFAHVGYGAIAYDATAGAGPLGGVVRGSAFDAGFALDLRPLSLFGAGVHAIYNGVSVNSDAPLEQAAFARSHWLSIGAHAAIYF